VFRFRYAVPTRPRPGQPVQYRRAEHPHEGDHDHEEQEQANKKRIGTSLPGGPARAGPLFLLPTARMVDAIYEQSAHHQGAGDPIQPLSTVHGAQYVDYSHGVRLASMTVVVDGRPRSICDALQDSHVAPVLSHEGGDADPWGLMHRASSSLAPVHRRVSGRPTPVEQPSERRPELMSTRVPSTLCRTSRRRRTSRRDFRRIPAPQLRTRLRRSNSRIAGNTLAAS